MQIILLIAILGMALCVGYLASHNWLEEVNTYPLPQEPMWVVDLGASFEEVKVLEPDYYEDFVQCFGCSVWFWKDHPTEGPLHRLHEEHRMQAHGGMDMDDTLDEPMHCGSCFQWHSPREKCNMEDLMDFGEYFPDEPF